MVSDATTPAVAAVPSAVPSTDTSSDSTSQMTITPVTGEGNSTAESATTSSTATQPAATVSTPTTPTTDVPVTASPTNTTTTSPDTSPTNTTTTSPAAATTSIQTDTIPVQPTDTNEIQIGTLPADADATQTDAIPVDTTKNVDERDISDNSAGTINSTTNVVQPTAMMRPKIKTQILSDAETSRLLAQTKKMASTDLNENIMHSQLAMEKTPAAKHTVHAAATTSPTYVAAVQHALSKEAAALVRASNMSSNNVVALKAHPKQIAIAKTNAKAWVVQMGSFRNTNNARRLIAQLQRRGFHAFGYTTQSAHQVLTEVYVGPAVEFKQAEVIAQNLNKQAHMKGIIVSFDARKLN